VLPDRVTVLADTAERAEEIDLERAEAARRRAEERLRSREENHVDFARADSALRRSIIRIKVAESRLKRAGRRPEP
jgi:F-type H+-transporting ATPase subunit epsilon